MVEKEFEEIKVVEKEGGSDGGTEGWTEGWTEERKDGNNENIQRIIIMSGE